jgi:hypothetical protein
MNLSNAVPEFNSGTAAKLNQVAELKNLMEKVSDFIFRIRNSLLTYNLFAENKI